MMNKPRNQHFMKQILLLAGLFALLPMGLKSQTYNYVPNALNIPFLTKKKDAALGIGWGRGDLSSAVEVQAVYSPLPHFAVMANYFGASDKNVRKRVKNGTSYSLWEAAAGVYEQFPKGAASLFAGFGAGNLYSHYGFDRTADFNLNRWFVQPGLSYLNEHFYAGLALRLSYLDYRRGIVSYSIEEQYLQYIQNIEKDGPMFLPEIGMQCGIHLNPAIIGIRLASIFPNTNSWDFSRINIGVSLAVNIQSGSKKVAAADESVE